MKEFKLMRTILLLQILSYTGVTTAIPNDSLHIEKIANVIPDTVIFSQLESINSSDNFNHNMPWVVALIIGILSVFVNFWIAKKLRESNERIWNQQTEQNNKTTHIQFQVTLNSKNRQEWINEVRSTLSDFLATALNITSSNILKGKTSGLQATDLQNMMFSKCKLDLLISDDKPEQMELLSSIDDMVKAVLYYSTDTSPENIEGREGIATARSRVVQAGRKFFDVQWKKIKDLK